MTKNASRIEPPARYYGFVRDGEVFIKVGQEEMALSAFVEADAVQRFKKWRRDLLAFTSLSEDTSKVRYEDDDALEQEDDDDVLEDGADSEGDEGMGLDAFNGLAAIHAAAAGTSS